MTILENLWPLWAQVGPGSWCLHWWFPAHIPHSPSLPLGYLLSHNLSVSFICLSLTQKSHKTRYTLSAKGPSSCSPVSECPKSHCKHGKCISLGTEKLRRTSLQTSTLQYFLSLRLPDMLSVSQQPLMDLYSRSYPFIPWAPLSF